MGWNSSLLISSQALEERPLGSPPLHQLESVPGSWTWGLGEGAKNWDGDPKKDGTWMCLTNWGCNGKTIIFINWLVVGPPLWKIWKSMGMMKFPIYGKIKLMFQTTNQRIWCFNNGFWGVPSTFKPCTVCQSGSECTFREGLRALEVLPSWQWQRNHPQQQTVTGGSFYILVMGVCPISLNFIKPLLLGIV